MKGEDPPTGACYDRRRHGKALIATEPALICWTPGTHHEMCRSAKRTHNNLSLELEVSLELCQHPQSSAKRLRLQETGFSAARTQPNFAKQNYCCIRCCSSSGLLTSVRGAAPHWELSPHRLHYCMLYPIRCPSHRDRWVVDARLPCFQKITRDACIMQARQTP